MRTRRGLVSKYGIVAAAIAAGVGLLGGGVASAEAGNSPVTQDHRPSSANDHGIPNLTKVKNEIEAYYGDHEVNGDHYASSDSDYGHQTRRIARRAEHYLAHANKHATKGDKPALVFDVDDTTLLSYGYEVSQDFGYDPASNAAWVKAEKMPAVFGMVDLVTWAKRHGYTVFFITGRPEAQRDATVGNLHKVGYRVSVGPHRLFLKNADNPPAYLTCGSHCTTIEYKSQTRRHIKSLGYDIVGNFGDQYSDLKGGYADRRFKMPNPMYYLP